MLKIRGTANFRSESPLENITNGEIKIQNKCFKTPKMLHKTKAEKIKFDESLVANTSLIVPKKRYVEERKFT